MDGFQTPIATWSCKTAGCSFACTTHDEAYEHKVESGHQWFHITGGMPGAVGVGYAA